MARKAAPKTPTKAAPKAGTEAEKSGKTIVLFSDGTGNSSAKLFKTNVWRMYEAVDLGPGIDPGDRDQIAYYDNGVGTSALKIMAILGGVFGVGLKRNVLTIYRYLCRNYEPGDRIYAFGFSRGAFTIRSVIALIGDQGIVDHEDEADLARQTHDAYRAFSRRNRPNVSPVFTWLAWGLQDVMLWLKRTISRAPPFRPSEDRSVPIAFVGVWDTVAAYGGPFAELTRGIDNWVWPLTMTDQQLGDNVEAARHALALDDERDSFQPVLWDEVHESRVADRAEQRATELEGKAEDEAERALQLRIAAKYRERLRQVWFSGMHADVGGGYPDESLSYISLLWMMREAGAAGLRLLPEVVGRVQDLSTPFGPMHDSREGFGSYYRYQPRKISAFLHPRGDGSKELLNQTLILRDPVIGEKSFRPQGLLMTCHVHDSVIARIESGTDSYAPIALPENFDISPPPEPPALSGTEERPPLVAAEVRERLKKVQKERYIHQENAWNQVFIRRWIYFATVFFTILLIALPWREKPLKAVEDLCNDDRCLLPSLISWLKIFLPQFAERWIESYANKPLTFLGLAIILIILLGAGASMQRGVRDRSLKIWNAALDRGEWPAEARISAMRRIRESRPYQRGFQIIKWYVLPTVFGVLLNLVILWILSIVVTQSVLAWKEPRQHFCTDEANTVPPIGRPVEVQFDVSSRCTPVPGTVVEGQTYRIVFQLPLDADRNEVKWHDGETPVTPRGAAMADLPNVIGYAGAGYRRVMTAGYLQPLVEIRGADAARRIRPDVHIRALELHEAGNGRYVGRFTADKSGRLYLFANDAAFPGLSGYFYGNNRGTATVTISLVGGNNTARDQARRPQRR